MTDLATEPLIIASEISLREFLMDFRKRIGRPMDEAEYTLARLAHGYGWIGGINWAYDDMLAHADDPTEAR